MLRWKPVVATLGFLIFLVILQVKNPEINGPFRGVLGTVLNPFVYYTKVTADGIGGVWDNYINLVNVRRENEHLKQQVAQAQMENTLLKERVHQAERLKRLLNFKEIFRFDTIACNVVGRNVSGYAKYLHIDRGLRDGIRMEDPVISFNGLVGRVSEVKETSATVLVILDLNSHVSVMNSRTRAVGILRGDGHGGMLVDYYDRLDAAKKDDMMITSGLGGVFPKGLPVGRISSATKQNTGLFQKVTVKESVDFSKLENVLIVKLAKN